MSRTTRYPENWSGSIRDKKRWYKSPKYLKKMMRKIQRAKEKEWFMRHLDILPVKRSNDWNWT